MENPKYNYMKYWRVIRYYVKAKYKISEPDLDILLFLYSEGRFTHERYRDFEKLLNWDNKRFNRLIKEGWIINFREGLKREKPLYELTYKGKAMVNTVYKKLNGEEIASTKKNNPLFMVNVISTDKIYRNFIIKMNKEIKDLKIKEQQQRHAPE
jgi:hypothetical protein